LRLSREQEERGKAIERQSDAIRRGVVFPPGALIPPSVPLPPGQGPRPPVLPLIDSIVPPVLLPPGDPRPQVDKK
ncbi:MAG: hypothetical protein MUF18_10865, partial [Fimbriiglobus sp.]|nr:hypothetical protein [Fimbriiglobus sp.]